MAYRAKKKPPPWTDTLLLAKKPWTTPSHDTLMLCKLCKYFNSLRVENRSKDWTVLSVLDCITSFSQPIQQSVAPKIFQHLRFWNSDLLKSVLTLGLPTWSIWWAPNNASKWQMGFNLAIKWLNFRNVKICFVPWMEDQHIVIQVPV
jgi:hypothetical protein